MRWIGVVGVLLCWVSLAVAGDGEREGAPQDLVRSEIEEILVTTTRMRSVLDRTGATVSLVESEDLEARQVWTAADAIGPVPGVFVRSGAPGSPTSVFLRGAGSNQTVVIVDGVQLNDPTLGGQFNFFDLQVENVERIEVLRGAASTLYGSDAAGGVIRLVTRGGLGAPSFRVVSEGGSYGRYLGGLSGQGTVGPLEFAGAVSRSRFHNELPNHESLTDTYALSLGLDLGGRLRITGRSRYVDAEAENPWDFPFGVRIEKDANIRRSRNSTLWALGLEHDLSDLLSWSLEGSLFHVNSLLENGPDRAGNPLELRSRAEADVRNLTLITRWNLPEVIRDFGLRFVVGAELEDEISENRVTTSFGPSPDLERSVRNRAIFALGEAEILENLVLSAGLRRDRNSFAGWETTFSGSVLLSIDETGSRLRFNYGEAFRAPKPIEFDDPWVGNEDLGSEESVQIDVGVEQDLFDGALGLGATWFSLRTSDLIAYDAGTFRLENLRRARSRGFELWARGKVFEGLEMRGWLTVMDPRNRSAKPGEERRLPGRAKRFGGGEIRVHGDGWRAGVEAMASDDFPGTGKITPNGTRRSHPGRKLVVALRGAVRICPAVWVHARVENLLSYEWYDDEAAPNGPGRGFYVGLSVEL